MASSVHSAPVERAVGAAALSDDPSTRTHAIRGANVLPSSPAASTQAIDHMMLALHHSSSPNIDATPPERFHRMAHKKAKKDKARREAKKSVWAEHRAKQKEAEQQAVLAAAGAYKCTSSATRSDPSAEWTASAYAADEDGAFDDADADSAGLSCTILSSPLGVGTMKFALGVIVTQREDVHNALCQAKALYEFVKDDSDVAPREKAEAKMQYLAALKARPPPVDNDAVDELVNAVSKRFLS